MGLNFQQDGWLAAIDFEAHPALGADGGEDALDGIDVRVGAGRVDTSDGIIQRNPETGGARVAFTFDPGENDAVELRMQLFRDGAAVSEVWLYRWTRAA